VDSSITTSGTGGVPPSRCRITTAVLQAFLDHAPDQGFIIFIDPERQDEYVQFKRSAGIVYGEVASRQWDVPERRRPLRSDADQQLDTRDVLAFRAALEAANSFDELPEWAQDWIRKAEQGPLQVGLQPPA
jgi:hypothetical protein